MSEPGIICAPEFEGPTPCRWCGGDLGPGSVDDICGPCITKDRFDIAKPETWPVRMTRAEISAVMRWSGGPDFSTLRKRIAAGRFPPPDDGHTWSREFVRQYVTGKNKDFEQRYQRDKRLGRLRVARSA